ncbi:MAG: class I SAM-dependent methyltransferase [Candidatus Njordarchaeota archaeon]
MNDYRKKVADYFNSIAEKYDRREIYPLFSYDELSWYVIDDLEWKYIKMYLPEKGIVLDVAGGTGRLAIPIAKLGLDVVLVDISEKMLSVARKKAVEEGVANKIRFILGDIHDLKFDDEYFDLVVAINIEYCDNLEKVLKEFHRIVKRDHYVIFSVDSLLFVLWCFLNLGDLKSVINTIKEGKYIDEDEIYCWAYTPSQLKQLCRHAGLSVEKIIGFGLCSFIKDYELRKKIFKDHKLRKLALKLETMISKIEDFAPIANHIIVIAKK